MILYLDTSAFVKLYVDEPSRDRVQAAKAEALKVACHDIGYVELRAALARLEREGRLTSEEVNEIRTDFERDWRTLLTLEATQPLLRKAAEFAEYFALRAYDSVHLAAADYLFTVGNLEVQFACFDRRLNRAAAALGMRVLMES